MPNTGQTTEYIRVQSSGWPSGPMRGRATPVYVAVSSGQRALRATVIKSSNHEGVPAIGGAAAAAAEHARTSEEQRKGHRASLVLRQLYRIEPLMEYGVNLSLYLVLLQSVRGLAERSQPTATR